MAYYETILELHLNEVRERDTDRASLGARHATSVPHFAPNPWETRAAEKEVAPSRRTEEKRENI